MGDNCHTKIPTLRLLRPVEGERLKNIGKLIQKNIKQYIVTFRIVGLRPKTGQASIKSSQLKYRYRISLEQFQQMIVLQGGLCLLCKRSLGDIKNTLAIDHDHACCSGTRSCGSCIRGILHKRCNSAIGLLEDNPILCRLAAEYLEQTSAKQFQ